MIENLKCMELLYTLCNFAQQRKDVKEKIFITPELGGHFLEWPLLPVKNWADLQQTHKNLKDRVGFVGAKCGCGSIILLAFKDHMQEERCLYRRAFFVLTDFI